MIAAFRRKMQILATFAGTTSCQALAADSQKFSRSWPSASHRKIEREIEQLETGPLKLATGRRGR